jgi:LEA14-like dessication related protein
VNGENVQNTGHAHLYVNGIKIARLYGPDFHIPDLPAGEHELTVNLSSNDHSYYFVNGIQIEARATITQNVTGMTGG